MLPLLLHAEGVATVRPSVLPIRPPALTKLPLFNPPAAPPTAAVRLDQTNGGRVLAARVGDAEFEVLRSVSELLVPSHTGGGGQFFALRGRRVRDRADLRLTAGELSSEVEKPPRAQGRHAHHVLVRLYLSFTLRKGTPAHFLCTSGGRFPAHLFRYPNL